jgi:uncharacterized integral membrane protein
MYKYLIVGIIASILIMVFALQNAQETLVTFWFWSSTGSLSLLMFICFLGGIITGVFFSLPALRKHKKELSKLKHNLGLKPDENKDHLE